jgi:hypothetical protein
MKKRGLLVLANLHAMGFQSFQTRAIYDAIEACGNDATDESLLDYLLDSSEKQSTTSAQRMSKLEQLKRLGYTSTAACIRAIENNRDACIGDLFDYVKADELSEKFEREDVSSKRVVFKSLYDN